MASSSVKEASSGRRTAQARQECILAAARTLFARHGFQGTGMAQIAKASNVLIGQIYRDFASKDALIAAIVERDLAELLDDLQVEASADRAQVDSFSGWANRLMNRRFDDEARCMFANILAEATRNPGIEAILACAYGRLRERVISATSLCLPHPEQSQERHELAELVLVISGAIEHSQIVGAAPSAALMAQLTGMLEAKVKSLTAI